MPNLVRLLDLFICMCKAGEGFYSYRFLESPSPSVSEQVMPKCYGLRR